MAQREKKEQEPVWCATAKSGYDHSGYKNDAQTSARFCTWGVNLGLPPLADKGVDSGTGQPGTREGSGAAPWLLYSSGAVDSEFLITERPGCLGRRGLRKVRLYDDISSINTSF